MANLIQRAWRPARNLSSVLRPFSTDALVEKLQPGEIGLVSGIPEEHLRRKGLVTPNLTLLVKASFCSATQCLGRRLFLFSRSLHAMSHDAPSQTLRRKIADIEKIRKKKNPKKVALFVEVPEGTAWLDTATMPMILTGVGIALFAKLLMMYDDSRSQELIERKIKNAPPGQGTVRMLTREEWEDIIEVRPRTPFESKLARPNARIRTDEPVRKEDLKDWTIDILTDAFTRAEETVKQNSK